MFFYFAQVVARTIPIFPHIPDPRFFLGGLTLGGYISGTARRILKSFQLVIEADVDFPKVKKFLKLDDRFLRYRLSKKKYYFFLNGYISATESQILKKISLLERKHRKLQKNEKKLGKISKGAEIQAKEKNVLKWLYLRNRQIDFENFLIFGKKTS